MKEQKILLGIDVGTTNVKVAAINHAGEILGFSSKALDVVHPKPNWAEQDSCQWWQKTAECIRETLGEIPGTAAEIAGIAGSAQGTGATPVDSSGNPLRNSLIWMDRCAQEQCDRLAEYTEKVFEVSGNAIDPVYNTLEMIWLKEHEPDIFKATHKFLTTTEFINVKLTGNFAANDSDGGNEISYNGLAHHVSGIDFSL